MNASNSISAEVVRDLIDALANYGPAGFTTQLAELANDYIFVLNSIANGYGNTERPADEDPAQELAELRAAFAPDINRISSLFHFVNSFAALMYEANRVDWVYQKTVNR